MKDLTKRQQEILTMIRDFMDDSGFPPTRADICRVMGFNSPNAAEEHLRTLERKGGLLAQFVDAAMHIGVDMLVILFQAHNHPPRLLRRSAAIQKRQRLAIDLLVQYRELATQGEDIE